MKDSKLDFKFSVVMAVYNKEEHISQAIDSIINQSLDFKKNIQIILINDKSSDNTASILQKFQRRYPENIIIIDNDKNRGSAFSKNQGLKQISAKYVNFLESDDYISKDAFKSAYEFLEKYSEVDIVSIPIYWVGVKQGSHNLNFKYKKNQTINVIEKPEYIQLSSASAFFRFDKLKDFQFNENLRDSEDSLLINQMLLNNPRLGCLAKPKYFHRNDGTQNSLINSSLNTKFFLQKDWMNIS